MRTLKYLFFIIAILVHIALLGCSQKEQGSAARNLYDSEHAYGDIIVEGSIGDASNLIPILSSDSTSHGIAAMVYNGLVKCY